MDRAEVLELREISATRPDYYRASSGRDVMDVIHEFGLGFMAGNVLKYIVRAGRKPGTDALDDLRKACEYVDRWIRTLEAERG